MEDHPLGAAWVNTNRAAIGSPAIRSINYQHRLINAALPTTIANVD
jgi:hypothetical protein